jgi:hypothetical protein
MGGRAVRLGRWKDGGIRRENEKMDWVGVAMWMERVGMGICGKREGIWMGGGSGSSRLNPGGDDRERMAMRVNVNG